MEISMIPAEKETPVKEEQLQGLFCLLINTKLMSLAEIMRIYVAISSLCPIPSTPGVLILTPGAAGWTLRDLWDMEKSSPYFLGLQEIRMGS